MKIRFDIFKIRLCATLALILASSTTALAQSYPTKTVKIIVPFAVGGGTDILTRVFAERLRAHLGQPVIVENHGGAGSLVGTELVAKAPPDGYTLLVNSDLLPVFPLLYEKVNFDVNKDFMPISFYASAPIVLVAHPSFQAKNVMELIAVAKKDPGAVSISTSGVGTPQDLAGMLFRRKANIKLNQIPYKGNGPALTDTLAGHVQLGIFTLSSVEQYARDGKLKILSIFANQRNPRIPDVPSMAEAGLQGVDVSSNYTLYGPAGMPMAVVSRLQDELAQVAKDPAYRSGIMRAGYEPRFTTAEETGRMLQNERERWAPILKAAGKIAQ
jgi:tripartite-type tricarboxylate transporter receptor subunit TctC